MSDSDFDMARPDARLSPAPVGEVGELETAKEDRAMLSDWAHEQSVTLVATIAAALLRDFDKLLARLSPAPVGEVGELIAGIDELAGKATARPWRVSTPDPGYCIDYIVTDDPASRGEQQFSDYVAETGIVAGPRSGHYFQQDAAFIVALVNAWPHLRRLASEGETLSASIKWYVDYANSKDAAVCEEMARANAAESEVSRLRGKVEGLGKQWADDFEAASQTGTLTHLQRVILKTRAEEIRAFLASLNPEKETTDGN